MLSQAAVHEQKSAEHTQLVKTWMDMYFRYLNYLISKPSK